MSGGMGQHQGTSGKRDQQAPATNPTSTHEGSIRGPTQWVKDLALH